MKSLVFIFSLVLALFAEPSFQDVQSMIANQQFKQAKLALTAITTNHPNSSKVYYTLAQANAGLGDLPAARDALDRAKALNPKLDFATSSQLADLEQAITPQAHLVTPIESSSIVIWWIIFTSATIATIWFVVFKPFNKPKPTSKPEQPSTKYSYTPRSTPPPRSKVDTTTTSPAYYSTPSHTSSYANPTPSPKIHHHHHSDSSISTTGTILTAGLTAAAVSTLMPDDKPSYSSHSEPSSSSSWEDSTPSSSSTWDDDSPSSRSSSWSDSSSSSSSWSDSSSSSSSSSSSWD